MDTKSIAEQLLFTTVRIETKNYDESMSVGTSFIFDYKLKDNSYLFLVTNKHVIHNAKEGVLTFVRGSSKPLLGKAYRLKIVNFKNYWVGHKKDEIDVAVMPFVPLLNYIYSQGVNIFFRAIPSTLIPDNEKLKELDAIEEVTFIGYPAGLWDEKNLLPIIRKGVTATPVYIDYNGEKQFLIDASVFPGSSGSPVFIYNSGIYWNKEDNSTVVGHRVLFLGILSAVFTTPDTGEIIIPTKMVPHVRIKQLVDIGIVFKAETIVETIENYLKEINAR